MAFFGKKDYLKDFRTSEAGEPVYTGELWRIREQSTFRKAAVLLLAASGSCVGSGCLSSSGASDAFYVILPFIGEMVCLFLLWWSFYKLLAERGRIRDYIKTASAGRISGAAAALTVLALAGLAASVFYLARHGAGESLLSAAAYPVLKLLTAAAAFAGRKIFAGIRWEKV